MTLSKRFTLFLALTALLSLLCLPAFAEGESATVFVTIANGSLMTAQLPVSVTDTDGDGALTIHDALYLAHEAAFDGGASAGYGTEETDWGLSLMKLWDVENGGSYGYYLNNASAMSLTDPVAEGDRLNAFVYTDTDTFSDAYAFFDQNSAAVKQGDKLDLTLSTAGFDENWAPVVLPAADAVITIDGKDTAFKTDAEGKASVKIDAKADCVISARSDSAILVPPALPVTVEASALPVPGLIAAAIAAAVVIFFLIRKGSRSK